MQSISVLEKVQSLRRVLQREEIQIHGDWSIMKIPHADNSE